MVRVTGIIRAEERRMQLAFDGIVLDQDQRHLRRKVLTLTQGEQVMVDFPEAIKLNGGDLLVLEDGRFAGIVAAEEELLEIVPRGPVHLAELAWHIGNRHLAAQIEADRILVLRDHVIKAMLESLGAEVREVEAPFEPMRGAYSGHGHTHHGHNHHGHDHHGHGHDHHHGEADSHGRLPGDPHYGHNHA
jgi:urease accessory protein